MKTSAIRPDINVTPLIDILLVMLVIFMAAVTLTQQAIESQLPAEARRIAEAPPSQIMLEMFADRRLAVNSQAVRSRSSSHSCGRSIANVPTRRSTLPPTARCHTAQSST